MTYNTVIASDSDRQEILEFISRGDLGMNVWLTQAVNSILGSPADHQHVLVCRSAEETVGVAAISGSPDTGLSDSYRLRMDAVDREAAGALMDALPEGVMGHFQVFHPMLQSYLGERQCSDSAMFNPYFTVSQEQFRPVGSDGVVEFTAADAGLFEGCEQQREWEHMGAENRVLGITIGGRAASSVACSPVTPMMPSGQRVVAISGLFTEEKHRRKGLGRQIVSRATELILRDGNIPCYWTEPENTASQGLCLSLGYYQYAREMRCSWRNEPTR